MKKEKRNDIFEKALKNLDHLEPDKPFALDILTKVKDETTLLKPHKDHLSLIPKFCIGGFVVLFAFFLFIFLTEFDFSAVRLDSRPFQIMKTTILGLLLMLLFMGFNRVIIKKYSK